MEISRLDYFAANAPEVPDWFIDRLKKETPMDWQQLKGSSPAALFSYVSEYNKKIITDSYFAWRKHYAEQMVKMLGGDQ